MMHKYKTEFAENLRSQPVGGKGGCTLWGGGGGGSAALCVLILVLKLKCLFINSCYGIVEHIIRKELYSYLLI